MIGCFVSRKCLVACLFFESSQQPTCPHERHNRRCTHSSPVLRQSSQPSAPGITAWIRERIREAEGESAVVNLPHGPLINEPWLGRRGVLAAPPATPRRVETFERAIRPFCEKW